MIAGLAILLASASANAETCTNCEVEQRWAVSNTVGDDTVTELPGWDACFVFNDFLGTVGVTNFRCTSDVFFDRLQNNAAKLYGTLQLESGPGDAGSLWTLEMDLTYRGKGVAGQGTGGPKLELLPGNQPTPITDTWDYYDMNGATLSRIGSNEYVTLTEYPANSVYPTQVGLTANGKNLGFGAATWYTFEHFVDNQVYSGLADMTADLAVAPIPPCDEWECNAVGLCTVPICGAAFGDCLLGPKCTDDGLSCTEATCDPDTGACAQIPIDAGECDDGNACTTDGWNLADCSCDNVDTSCDDGNPCTIDSCDAATGECINDGPAPPCDDGDPCTADVWNQDACACEYTPIEGDDCCEEPAGGCPDQGCLGGLWDQDTCSCTLSPDDGACDDGNLCTVDTCTETGGCDYSGDPCDDGDACTIDACDPATGACTNDPKCTTPDLCSEIACDSDTGECGAVTAKVCEEDDDPCTVALCLPSNGECQQVNFCPEIVMCPDDTTVAHECGDIPTLGRCQGSVRQSCVPTQSGLDPTFTFELEDCAASGHKCGWDDAKGQFGCVPAPEDDPHDCRHIPLSNSCDGNLLTLCGEEGAPQITDCFLSGLVCGFTGTRYDCIPRADCVPQCDTSSCGDDGCGGICNDGGCAAGLTCAEGHCCNCPGEDIPDPPEEGPEAFLLGGPSCSTLDRGAGLGGTAFALLVLAALSLFLWRRRRTAAALALAALLMPAPSQAQGVITEGFNVQHFMPVPNLDRIFHVEGTSVTPAGRPAASVFLHFMRQPLRFETRFPNGDETLEDRIDDFVAGDVGLALGLFGFMDIQAVLPFKLNGAGDEELITAVEDAGLGNLWLRLRIEALDRASYNGFGLGFQAGLEIPVGKPETMNASQHTGVQLGTAATYESGRWLSAANARFMIRKNQRATPNLLIGDEFRYGIGTSYRVLDWMRLGGEIYGRVSLETTEEGNYPVELIMGPRFMPTTDLHVEVGVGAGLSEGYGAPDWRVLVGLTWAMSPKADPEPIAPPIARCGNGIVEPGEDCDDAVLVAEGLCDGNCKHLTPPPAVPVCGNGILEPGEECDDGSLNGKEWCDTACKKIPVRIALAPVFFDTDVTDIRAKSWDLLRRNVELLKKDPSIKIRIRGHADVRAPRKHNCHLSEARVNSVKQQLEQRGIDPSRMIVEWVGQEEPTPPGTEPRQLQLNRRVDFELLASDADRPFIRQFLCPKFKPRRPENDPKGTDPYWAPEDGYLKDILEPPR